MVKATGAASGPGALRPLNQPVPVAVETDADGWPTSIAAGARNQAQRARSDRHARPDATSSGLRMPASAFVQGASVRRTAQAVHEISDIWRIEDEWWRGQPVSRTYFDTVLEDGRRMTLFQDRVTGAWFRQHYG